MVAYFNTDGEAEGCNACRQKCKSRHLGLYYTPPVKQEHSEQSSAAQKGKGVSELASDHSVTVAARDEWSCDYYDSCVMSVPGSTVQDSVSLLTLSVYCGQSEIL